VTRGAPSTRVRLGLKENWRQFAMLVLVNAFVGGMVGIERTVVPLVGSEEYGLVLKTAIFSFIISFGLVKACSNLVSGVFPLFFSSFGLSWAIGSVGVLTFASGAVVAGVFRETKQDQVAEEG
jgi:hypothetical protein